MARSKIWSFDDLHIGKLKNTGMSLETKEIPRPPGLTNKAWYEFAGKVIKVMNGPKSR